MGLFSKEACTFCQTEVGMLKRSKLQTKEYICNDCKKKTNYFARMDHTSRAAAQRMMETMAQEAAEFEASFDSAENRFQSAERHFRCFDLGSKRVQYRCNTRLGAFQLEVEDMRHYAAIPVFWFSQMMPYQFRAENDVLSDMRRAEMMDEAADYVRVEESRNMDGEVTGFSVIIPYDDACIREIRLASDTADGSPFQELADRINQDRRTWLAAGDLEERRRNEMQLRNLGDTAAAVLQAAISGKSVEAAVKEGVETAEAIEEGKVKQGFFGKLFRK